MSEDIVLNVIELGSPPWPTADPFLFCVHHLDHYPAGNENMGIDRDKLQGRMLGNDFSGKDGFSMYHGEEVPGFPRHPHRGFETITVARQGYIDHSDSLGATARFGEGDVQWMTAGNGVVHSESFPLINPEAENPRELFQIWLNLPREDKKKDAHFKMLWHENIPQRTFADDEGKQTRLTVIAGTYDDMTPPEPPPASWAAREQADIAVWSLELDAGASWTAPPARPESNRVFYFFAGKEATVGGRKVRVGSGVQVEPNADCEIVNGDEPAEILMLQGRPIGEQVVQHGPFVMNTQGEIRQAMIDYQRTQFGGWPWDDDCPVHPRDEGRFAVHVDGREERPE